MRNYCWPAYDTNVQWSPIESNRDIKESLGLEHLITTFLYSVRSHQFSLVPQGSSVYGDAAYPGHIAIS